MLGGTIVLWGSYDLRLALTLLVQSTSNLPRRNLLTIGQAVTEPKESA
jgi:hypothetical protein